MLALADSALARLCIGATRIDPRRRRQWLQEIAAKLDPPRTVVGSRECSRPARARRKNGTRSYPVEIPDQIAEGVITALVATEKLTEAEACDHSRVQVDLAICCVIGRNAGCAEISPTRVTRLRGCTVR